MIYHVFIVILAIIGVWMGVERALDRHREDRLNAENDDHTPRYERPEPYDEPLSAAELKAMERWFS